MVGGRYISLKEKDKNAFITFRFSHGYSPRRREKFSWGRDIKIVITVKVCGSLKEQAKEIADLERIYIVIKDYSLGEKFQSNSCFEHSDLNILRSKIWIRDQELLTFCLTSKGSTNDHQKIINTKILTIRVVN